jgi:hypothetical protein
MASPLALSDPAIAALYERSDQIAAKSDALIDKQQRLLAHIWVLTKAVDALMKHRNGLLGVTNR